MTSVRTVTQTIMTSLHKSQTIMTSLHVHTLTLCNILYRVDEKSCFYKDVIYFSLQYLLFRIAILFRFNSKKKSKQIINI